MLAGRTDREARKGALISACMIPPIGIGGILVGMYTRMNTPETVLLDEALLAVPFDPLFVGMGIALLCLAVGLLAGKARSTNS